MRGWIDDAVLDAIRKYLRTCSSGGMPDEQIELIDMHADAAADLAYFSIFVAGAMDERKLTMVASE